MGVGIERAPRRSVPGCELRRFVRLPQVTADNVVAQDDELASDLGLAGFQDAHALVHAVEALVETLFETLETLFEALETLVETLEALLEPSLLGTDIGP